MDVATSLFVTLVAITGAGLIYIRVIEPVWGVIRDSDLMSRILDAVHEARLSDRLSASESLQTKPDRLSLSAQTGPDGDSVTRQTGQRFHQETNQDAIQDVGKDRKKASRETVRLLREAGVTRDQARAILRSVGLSLDNNMWSGAASDTSSACTDALTPIARRPYNPSLYRDV